MDTVAAGFWGAFFGTAALMLVLSLAAFVRSHRRVALMAALSALISAAFVVAYLGWLPLGSSAQARLLSHVAMPSGVTLALMLLSMLGLLRQPAVARRAYGGLIGAAVVVIAVGWWLEPSVALALSSVAAFAVGAGMLALAVRSALRGDRLAWASVTGVSCMLVAVAGLSWIALHRDTPWPVHALSAVAGMTYLTVMAAALWARYSYLLELSEVLAHGPSYDPVTRMRSHSETTGQMLGDVFFRREGSARPVGVVVICIANLYALENLHGRAAVNHALFLCAGRLRRTAPVNAEMGRLGEDGFLLLLRTPQDIERMALLARQLKERLSRPVALSTRREGVPQGGDTAWVAEVGVGLLATSTGVRPSQAVSTARAIARTAWSYTSRLAFYDLAAGQIAELPASDAAASPG